MDQDLNTLASKLNLNGLASKTQFSLCLAHRHTYVIHAFLKKGKFHFLSEETREKTHIICKKMATNGISLIVLISDFFLLFLF